MNEPNTDTGVVIRASTIADLPRMIEILYDDPPMEMRGLIPDLGKARRVGKLIVEQGLEVAVPWTVLAVVDGVAAGLMEARRPGENASPGIGAIVRVLAGGTMIIGPQGLLRYLRYQRARPRVRIDHPRHSYYIGELDVHPDYRNRGIGATLLRHGEREARSEGFAQMSLTTAITNPAQHLYEREGYRIVETKRHAAYERITGIPGRVLMVKDLAPEKLEPGIWNRSAGA